MPLNRAQKSRGLALVGEHDANAAHRFVSVQYLGGERRKRIAWRRADSKLDASTVIIFIVGSALPPAERRNAFLQKVHGSRELRPSRLGRDRGLIMFPQAQPLSALWLIQDTERKKMRAWLRQNQVWSLRVQLV
jgi:hypothetical protein